MDWLERGWEVWGYTVTSALVSLWRHRVMTGATVLTTAVMLLMLNAFVMVVNQLNVALDALERRVNVVAYIRDDAPPGEVLALRDQLRQNPNVLDVTYVTKEEAMARLRQHFADRQELLAMVPGNPLPASLEIRARNPSQLGAILAILRASSVLEEVALQEDVVDRMLRLTAAARSSGLVMIAGLAGVTLFIVVNTIRLAVYSRRHEIEVMKLVGATDWFIRWPFLVEGMLYGLLGALLTLVVVIPAYPPLRDQFWALLTFLPVQEDSQFITKLAVMTLAVGVSLGAAGSYISVRRFLEV